MHKKKKYVAFACAWAYAYFTTVMLISQVTV